MPPSRPRGDVSFDADYLAAPQVRGLRSRARGRAVAEGWARLWANRAWCALRQLWRGRLDDSLLQSAANGLRGASEPGDSALLCHVVEKVRRCWAARSAVAPVGAAAVLRQQGASHVGSGPGVGAEAGELPRRGQIWPAEVSLLALPVGDRAPLPMVDHSPRCAEFLQHMEQLMLAEVAERKKLQEELKSGAQKPYRDPKLEEQIYELAVRLAGARMLRAVKTMEAEVGYFAVIKEATRCEDGSVEIVLRLIFDQIAPNGLWRRPPWVALAGPGCLAAVELSGVQEESAGTKALCSMCPTRRGASRKEGTR